MERADRIGAAATLAGHGLIFALMSVTLMKTVQPHVQSSPPIEIEIRRETALESTAPVPASEAAPSQEADIQQVETTNTPEQVVPTPKVAAKPEPLLQPLPKPVKVEAQPVTQKPSAMTKAVPKPKEKSQPQPAKKPTPIPKAPAAPAAKAAPKPSAQKPTAKPAQRTGLDIGRLEADLARAAEREKASKGTSSSQGTSQGRGQIAQRSDAELKASFIQAMLSKMKPFWKAPTGADAELLRTHLMITLNRNGTIAKIEVVEQTGVTDSNLAQKALHAERATRAVQRAAPFDLPADLYDKWRLLGPIIFDKKLN
jgi:outer membrane biosynthesis protein TonB